MHTLLGNFNRSRRACVAALALAVVLIGCKTQKPPATVDTAASAPSVVSTSSSNSLTLQPGDNIKISFPGAPTLDAQTVVRVDGKISLPSIGELPAAGLTPSQLEKDLLRVADPQLVVKQVNVTVISSAFEVYVSGAVLRPGKLVTDRVLTPLEAVMEAGLDYQKANLKNVQIIRKLDDGQTENFKLNLKKPLEGAGSQPFALKQYDIIYVPERFSWF